MLSKRDYYETLGVNRDADDITIKSAYRKLAMKHHPDKNPGDQKSETLFKESTEAYEVLKDKEKRAAYDRYGHAAFQGGNAQGNASGFSNFSGSFSDIFDEMFGDFMGNSSSQQRQNRGNDLRYDIDISLEDAFAGSQKEIQLTTASKCDNCKGSGSSPDGRITSCSTCNGKGRVRVQQGFFAVERECHSCNGEGQIISKPCKTCNGNGIQNKKKTLSVNIPSGVDNGTRIRLSGEGEAGSRGGQNGDLYIFVQVRMHNIFTREGKDVYCQVPLDMASAALGGNVEVPTIDGGRIKINYDPGTQSGKRFRLRGKGMTGLRGSNRGDAYVETLVETPVNLTKRQKELLKEFSEESLSKGPKTDSFTEKLKKFWNS
tara:strand:+ start:742 stop:1863 length:1122 start_codon:yes stop_codon:yes gene_type:complete